MQAPDRRAANLRFLAPLLFVLIVAAAIGAGAVALSSRKADLELYARVTRDFAPTGGQPFPPGARISFRVGEDDADAAVQIVDEDDRPVRTLAADTALAADRRYHFRWTGKDDAGHLQPAASYRLRVVLPDSDRDMIWPRRMQLHR